MPIKNLSKYHIYEHFKYIYWYQMPHEFENAITCPDRQLLRLYGNSHPNFMEFYKPLTFWSNKSISVIHRMIASLSLGRTIMLFSEGTCFLYITTLAIPTCWKYIETLVRSFNTWLITFFSYFIFSVYYMNVFIVLLGDKLKNKTQKDMDWLRKKINRLLAITEAKSIRSILIKSV